MSTEQSSEVLIAAEWANEDSFTLNQVAALFIGVAPPQAWIDDPDHPYYDPNNLPTQYFKNDQLNRFEQILKRLQKAIGDGENGELEVKYFSPDYEYNEIHKTGERDYSRPHPNQTYVTRTKLKEWAETQALYPTFLFGKGAQAYHWNRILTLCLDETKEYHPKPLAIAIKAWEYFYIEGNINKDKEENEKQDGHAEQFKNYINSSYAKSDDGCYELLTTNMINHIAAVAHKDPRSKRKPKKIIKN